MLATRLWNASSINARLLEFKNCPRAQNNSLDIKRRNQDNKREKLKVNGATQANKWKERKILRGHGGLYWWDNI